MTKADIQSETRFTDHVLGLSLDQIPGDVIETAVALIRDSLAVGIAGAGVPLSENILTVATGWGKSDAGFGSTVLGRGIKLPPASAAFVNGFQIHCQEYDCVHETAVVHPMATILAALLATAEAEENAGRPVSGAQFISAIIGAVDVATGLGLAVSTPLKFFRPATAGLFGATLGAAKLRGFDRDQALNALGLALAHCSGSMQAHVEGKPTLPIQIANAARGAVAACDLAEAGLAGPLASLEGPYGYLPLFEDAWDLSPILDSLGKTWRVNEVSYKVYPTGRAAQGGLLGIEQLQDSKLPISEIESLVLSAPPIMKRLVGRPWKPDMEISYARLCFAYLGAVALLHDQVGLGDFTPERLSDPMIGALAARISVEDNGVPDPAAFAPQQLTATLKNGAVQTFHIPELPGSPGGAFDRAAQLDKALKCLNFELGEAEAAQRFAAFEERMDALPDRQSIQDLLDIVFLR